MQAKIFFDKSAVAYSSENILCRFKIKQRLKLAGILSLVKLRSLNLLSKSVPPLNMTRSICSHSKSPHSDNEILRSYLIPTILYVGLNYVNYSTLDLQTVSKHPHKTTFTQSPTDPRLPTGLGVVDTI